MDKDKQGGDVFIVDNSDADWKVRCYLHDWADLAHAIDIATGYFEIGGLLALEGQWQKVDKFRVLMGDEVSLRTRKAFTDALKTAETTLDESIEREKETNDFLTGVPAIVDAIRSGKIECRVYTKNKFHAKDDRPEICYEVFKLLRRHAITFYAVVRDKQRVIAEVHARNRKDPSYWYSENELYDTLVLISSPIAFTRRTSFTSASRNEATSHGRALCMPHWRMLAGTTRTPSATYQRPVLRSHPARRRKPCVCRWWIISSGHCSAFMRRARINTWT